MPRRGWLALLLLAPLALLAAAAQVAVAVAVVGAGEVAWGGQRRDSDVFQRGIATVQRAAGILDAGFSAPTTRLLDYNPITLGAMDDLRATVSALAVGSRALGPLGEMAVAVLGFDGAAPMVSGATIDPARVTDLASPVEALHDDLTATGAAVAAVPGTGLLGRPIGMVRDSVAGYLSDVTEVVAAVETAMPALPEALGADRPRRYLVCALNDAEVFASGGAPLTAFLVQAERGTITVPVSGQLESELSPGNPSIVWKRKGGPPWYRAGKKYPFVNSNFHPDFRTASRDMRRAWAALDYPRVQGVITIDMGALASVLSWTGGVRTPGFGTVGSDNLVRTVLVDSYREFNSRQGVLERHARNSELTQAVMSHVASPLRLLPALRGVLDAIPSRHVQASFDAPELQRAVAQLGASGALQKGSGDVVGVYSQSGPNKLSVFQRRTISHEVQLTADGGAEVRRTVSFGNDVPEGLAGDPATYRGYLALRARMRVAYRVPLDATDFTISTGRAEALVPLDGTGPFPDDRGAQVLWQGHETAPGDVTTVEMRYTLPAGTFAAGSYEVHADPQALTLPTTMRIRVSPAPGTELAGTEGWTRAGSDLVWSGTLDRPLHLGVS